MFQTSNSVGWRPRGVCAVLHTAPNSRGIGSRANAEKNRRSVAVVVQVATMRLLVFAVAAFALVVGAAPGCDGELLLDGERRPRPRGHGAGLGSASVPLRRRSALAAAPGAPDEYRFLASVTRQSGQVRHECNGVLVSSRLVLTTKSCLSPLLNGAGNFVNVDFVVVGRYGLGVASVDSVTRAQSELLQAVLHPDEDAAVIVLQDNADAPITTIDPVQVHQTTSSLEREGQSLDVVGWSIQGTQAVRIRSMGIPHIASVPVLNGASCGLGADATALCAGFGAAPFAACFGAQGAPLLAEVDGKKVLVGLAADVDGCGDEAFLGSFTRASSIAEWLEDLATETDTEISFATALPTAAPTKAPAPGDPPTPGPTTAPSESDAPSPAPSQAPLAPGQTLEPTPSPTDAPTDAPTDEPTDAPTATNDGAADGNDTDLAGSSGVPIAPIIGGCAGVSVLAAAFLLVQRRRRRRSHPPVKAAKFGRGGPGAGTGAGAAGRAGPQGGASALAASARALSRTNLAEMPWMKVYDDDADADADEVPAVPRPTPPATKSATRSSSRILVDDISGII